MKVTFLGTGTSQGVPIIACNCEVCKSKDPKDSRLRSSICIEINHKTIIIDSGPDFRQQMLRENITDLNAILFTHDHRDHIAGLDDVRAFNFIYNKPIDVYAEKNVFDSLECGYPYIFSKNKYPGAPNINDHIIKNENFMIDDIRVTPIRVMHDKLPILGFRINDFTYITDASYISEDEKHKIAGTKILTVNALRIQKHPTHFNLNEAVRLVKELSPKKAYLTHISHKMGLHEAINKDLPSNIQLAYDGLSFEI